MSTTTGTLQTIYQYSQQKQNQRTDRPELTDLQVNRLTSIKLTD